MPFSLPNRYHHRLKTFGGWWDRSLPDGAVISLG